MCGACGRAVVPDPVLGVERTRRDLLVVAQLVNAVASGLSGVPVVRVSGDGWSLAGRTGTSTACDTVQQLWEELLDSCARVPGASSHLADRIAGDLSEASPLAERVLRAGLCAAHSDS